MSSNASLVHSLSLDRSLMIDSTHFPQPQAPNTTTTAMTPKPARPALRYYYGKGSSLRASDDSTQIPEAVYARPAEIDRSLGDLALQLLHRLK